VADQHRGKAGFEAFQVGRPAYRREQCGAGRELALDHVAVELDEVPLDRDADQLAEREQHGGGSGGEQQRDAQRQRQRCRCMHGADDGHAAQDPSSST